MNRLAYKKNKGVTVSLMLENNKQYYNFLNVYCIPDSNNLWRVVKQNFSNKIVATNRVILRWR